ncbi:hypothetical protein MAR_037277 [Mya arenaria]|uniref:Uncharacterized protein n=1 Tax=Mya arenaria TaxID=6604 RepID=A0ABY7FN16_MYAAR|nr:hypothetical protein MAR_037277 [Mya arenaria]
MYPCCSNGSTGGSLLVELLSPVQAVENADEASWDPAESCHLGAHETKRDTTRNDPATGFRQFRRGPVAFTHVSVITSVRLPFSLTSTFNVVQ